MKWLHKLPKWLYVFVLFLPLIVVIPISLLSPYFILDNPEFWYGYMSYFGTVCLAIVAVWQSNDFEDRTERRDKQLFKLQVYNNCSYFVTDSVEIITNCGENKVKFHVRLRNTGKSNALSVILQDFEFGRYGYKIGKEATGEAHEFILKEYGYIAEQQTLEFTSPIINSDIIKSEKDCYAYFTMSILSDNQMMFDQEIQLRFCNNEDGLVYSGAFISKFFELYDN